MTIVNIDTGGTFTDIIATLDETTKSLKTRTTPHDLTICFTEAIEKIAGEFKYEVREFLNEIEYIRYSTTIGTNIIIEKNGADVGLLASGETIASIADQGGDLTSTILDENRIRELSSLDERELSEKYSELSEEFSSIVAVKYGDYRDEKQVRDTLLKAHPRHFLGSVPIHLSSDLTRDQNDRRRLNTVLIDSYIHPSVATFLYKAEDFLRDHGYSKPLMVFNNDGSSTAVSKTTALKSYNSGPAGGVNGAAAIADHYGSESVISVDIGGTSTDVAKITGGEPPMKQYGEIGGLDVSISTYDVTAVSGGGGTIATVEDGELSLGPESTGITPGPACYGFGGSQATVTDANVVLGLITPASFQDSSIMLDEKRAEQVLREEIAEPLGLDVHTAALTVRKRLEHNISQSIRQTLFDSSDPAAGDATIVAYGGSGPIHAGGIAEAIGIEEVIVPDFAPVFSAYGIGFSELRKAYDLVIESGTEPDDAVERVRATKQSAVRDMQSQGLDEDQVKFTIEVYTFDEYDRESIGTLTWESLRTDLVKTMDEWGDIKLQITAARALPTPDICASNADEVDLTAETERNMVWMQAGEQRNRKTPIYDFDRIGGQHTARGPAVFHGASTSLAVPPNWELTVNKYGHRILRLID